LFLISTLLVIAAAGRVSTTHDDHAWTLANDQIQVTFELTAAGLELRELLDARTGRILSFTAPDSAVTIEGTPAALGSSAAGWVLLDASSADVVNGTQLRITFRSTKAPIVATRTYACYTGSPAIEAWTTFRATGSSAVTVSNPTIWDMTVRASLIHYELGLRGDDGPSSDDAFTLRSVELGRGLLTLDERNRSTEHFLPVVTGDLENDEFFGGLMWSGAWQIALESLGRHEVHATASIPRTAITVDQAHPLETPHGFFGFTPGGRDDVSAALHEFVMQGVRQGRPFSPLVTDNTWFSYGTDIDQQALMDEMAGAASVGAELFVVDAGWFLGAGTDGNFDAGLGNWEVDPARFPDGLEGLRDYAHSLGLLFGLWVEPERVARSTVGDPEHAQQAWLASNNGEFGSSTTAMICLASPAARQWITDRLVSLIDEAQPDYLKWDNNLWVNCNRGGHGHGSTDGNFQHVKGLYDVLQTLRDRYPDMVIENCSQGGNRADFGMLRYTDTAWMDDHTSPALHVRHNLQGLMTFFPPAYLLSFVLNDGEPIVNSPDLGLFLRSRMPGILGLTYRSSELAESDRDRLAHEISVYKSIRDIVANASGALLTGQAAPESGPPWDAVQEVDATSGNALVFAFQDDAAAAGIVRPLRGLTPDAVYTITTADGQPLGTATGASLMSDGLQIDESFESAARLFVLRSDRPPPARSVIGPKGRK